MNESVHWLIDPKRTQLRVTVAVIEGAMARLPKQVATDGGKTAMDELQASWADLVAQLALGPEPEVRECPVCKQVSMRAATLCSNCWTKLLPPT